METWELTEINSFSESWVIFMYDSRVNFKLEFILSNGFLRNLSWIIPKVSK